MKPSRLWILSSGKTIPYADMPGISRMMKECSYRAVSDKMDVGVVEKKKILRHRSSSYEMDGQRLFLIFLKWRRA
jgi:hypothetical protein